MEEEVGAIKKHKQCDDDGSDAEEATVTETSEEETSEDVDPSDESD